ncbi:MAG: outer membrane lipoprotein chaperone LolA [Steroidobacteraceae bacterium]
MNRRWRLLVTFFAFAGCGPVLAAADQTALDGYLAGLTTWSANFTQSVKDAGGKLSGAGRGRLLIVQPLRFRWESAPEGSADAVQLLVADGRNLWFFDRDLEQATVKPQKDAMPQSPAMLLAGGAELRAAFSIQSNGRRDGLEWVRVLPKSAQSDFREALFGFKGRELSRLIIADKLGQRSTLDFSDVKRNAPVDPQLVQFTLPKGVDLIGTPVPP